jgi:hypothetical protein
MTANETTKSTLLLWLNLLGWQVDVRQKGDRLVGVARHVSDDGSSFRVSGSAATRDELAYQLFEAVLQVIEVGSGRRSLIAA